MKIDLVVPAAGSGQRMQKNQNKMFIELDGLPILYRCLFKLNSFAPVRRIQVVIKPEEMEAYQAMIQRNGPLPKLLPPVPGGKERSDSVRRGLDALLAQPEGATWIGVHDGARPFLTERLMQKLMEACPPGGVAIPGLPLSETLRRKGPGGTQVVDRNHIYAVQTPQLFSSKDAMEVFFTPEALRANLTDEASYFELQGRPVELVEGESWNVKITRPEDLPWCEAMLAHFRQLRVRY